MTLGLTGGRGDNRGLFESSSNVLQASSGYYGLSAGSAASSGSGRDVTLGITTDPQKSGMVADLSDGICGIIKY